MARRTFTRPSNDIVDPFLIGPYSHIQPMSRPTAAPPGTPRGKPPKHPQFHVCRSSSAPAARRCSRGRAGGGAYPDGTSGRRPGLGGRASPPPPSSLPPDQLDQRDGEARPLEGRERGKVVRADAGHERDDAAFPTLRYGRRDDLPSQPPPARLRGERNGDLRLGSPRVQVEPDVADGLPLCLPHEEEPPGAEEDGLQPLPVPVRADRPGAQGLPARRSEERRVGKEG